jgi:hypothetical protein
MCMSACIVYYSGRLVLYVVYKIRLYYCNTLVYYKMRLH